MKKTLFSITCVTILILILSSCAKNALREDNTEQSQYGNKDILAKLENHEAIFEQLKAEEESLLNSITELEKQVNELKESIGGLKNEQSGFQDRSEDTENNIIEEADDSISLTPGEYKFGENGDIPAGRYIATGNGYFFVYDAKGRLKTDVIFGFEVDSYTFEAGEDYTLDTRGTCTLTPIRVETE